jgi:hypothetical protein
MNNLQAVGWAIMTFALIALVYYMFDFGGMLHDQMEHSARCAATMKC